MPTSPRVRCGGCAFEWFGRISAHGLRVVGSCPRCSGTLEFLVEDDEEDAADEMAREVEAQRRHDGASPAQVLGVPNRRSWPG